MQIYAIPGETAQYIGKAPPGAILMQELNPGGWTAQADGTWVEGPELLKAEAKAKLAATLAMGFSWYGVQYQCEEKDMVQWTRGFILMSQPDAPERTIARAMDNSHVDMTKDRFLGLCKKAAETYEAALRQYWEDTK